MARYGHDYHAYSPYGGGRYPGERWEMGYRPRHHYGNDYSGGWNGAEYGIHFDNSRGRFGGHGYDAPMFRSREAGAAWARDRGGERSQRMRGEVDEVSVADIMTRNPEAVTPDTTLVEVARKMRELDVGIIPVVEDMDSLRLRGVITDRDIAVRAAAEGKDMKKARVEDFMSADVETVGESAHVRDVFTVMKRERVRRVPVTDEQGALVGIVAQADLAVTYAGLDLKRETEVEEVIERISEPARPRWGREGSETGRPRFSVTRRSYDEPDFTDRVREGWRTIQREARHMMGRGYDHRWR